MPNPTFIVTKQQQESLCMAFLAYSGETLLGKKDSVEKEILGYINESMTEISVLCKTAKTADWDVVWGPAIYTLEYGVLQDNMMFVVQQISKPKNFIVGIRGTNGGAWLDWIEEDLDVLKKVDWKLPEGKTATGTPKISQATETGFKALLTEMTSPKDRSEITAFLKGIALTPGININFTGHSLAGALAPTLALWFKQSQIKDSGWDPNINATITTTPFAGATAGNTDFAAYSHNVLGNSCERIHNMNDVVPHGWETKSIKELPDLYSSIGIKVSRAEKWIIDIVADMIQDYKQLKVSYPFTFPLNKKYDSFTKQTEYQHTCSYTKHFDLTILDSVINRGPGSKKSDCDYG